MHEEEYCPSSPSEVHIPDWHTLTTDFDGETLYLDVNCKYCGKSGCVGKEDTLAKNINW